MFRFFSASFNVGSHSETYYFNFAHSYKQCVTSKNFSFLRQKNCARVHKLMFYVANRTFYENSFLFSFATFFVVADLLLMLSSQFTKETLNPKNSFLPSIKMQNHKKKIVSICAELPEVASIREQNRHMSVNWSERQHKSKNIEQDTFLISGGH